MNDRLVTQPSTYITAEAFENSSAKWIPEGALLVALAGQGRTKGMVAQLAFRSTCNQSMAAIIPGAELKPRFLYWWLDSNYQNIRNLAGGDLRDGLNLELLGDVHCPVPPLSEQAAIGGVLDAECERIDALVAQQYRLIGLLSEKRQAVISHAVTKGLNPNALMKPSGVEWLGDVPAHWEVGGLTKYLSSVVDYRGRTPTKVDDGVRLLTARNIRDGQIDYDASAEYIKREEYEAVMSRGNVEISDVLFTTEAPLGQVANVDRTDIALAQRIIKFRGRSGFLDNQFLKYWLLGDFAQADMQRLATGSTALGIKGSKVSQLRVVIPPIAEQTDIVDFLTKTIKQIDLLKHAAQHAIELLKERRTALISAAVTGQIDVHGHASVEVV